MNLATGSFKTMPLKTLPFNMRFVLKVLKKAVVDKLLSDTHMSIYLRVQQKQANEDYAAFREIVGRQLVHA
jgi:hypothetical protein